ncbi:hypothetical protein GCM10008018_01600 [Paenibacillus marchantiophytorum]|uniref:DUF4349 domain-containing protein n=1 Tax=Paenibacillus marchantiophytorum TaxID=1619310 RepID=A0ABQ2BPY9_9BACL|nr:DUF4349 domain-containing protein [Paenibacillus marchantiophytorum]GGI43345.1 hypothetical protein GCM10008018_01600 [Paenibacillus marchantiophytorum]
MGVFKRKASKDLKRSVTRGRVGKGLTVLIATAVLAALLAGCSAAKDSSKSSSASEMKNDAMADSMQLSVTTQSDAKAAGAPAAQAAASGQKVVEKSSADTAPGGSKSSAITVMPATGSDEAAGFNRKLIYRANLVMPVEDYSKSQTALRDLVALSGAYILQFSENANTGERGGTYTIKVAANGFVSLLDGLEKMSPSLQRSVQGQDVTEQYVDLSSRLKAKQLVETRLLSFMEKAVKTDDLLAFSNELSKVQETIEQIKGQMRYLDQNVAFSTIELRMYQQTGNKPLLSDPNKSTLEERIQKAWNSSLNVLVTVMQGILVFLAAAFPVIVIGLLIGGPIWAYRRKRNKQLVAMRNELKAQNASLNALDEEQQATKDIE